MKIAVTGASGFVGRHLVSALAAHGHEVVCLVRNPAITPEGLTRHQVRAFDIDSADGPSAAFAAAGQPDVLVHLAWGHLNDFRSLVHFEAELPRHYGFLRAMVTAGLQRLVVTGTCLEYGLQSGPLGEEMDTRPACAYALAKDTLRRQLEVLRQQKPFELTWARLFYVYGDGQPERTLWSSVKRAAQHGQARFAMSPGDQLRDYLEIGAMAELLAKLSASDRGHGVVNVCSGHPVSVRSLVEQWIRDNGWRLSLDLGVFPYADYEPLAFWGDRRKLDACIGI